MGFLYKTVRGEWYAQIGYINPLGHWIETVWESPPCVSQDDAKQMLAHRLNQKDEAIVHMEKPVTEWITGEPYMKAKVVFIEREMSVDPLVLDLHERLCQMVEGSADQFSLPTKAKRVTPAHVNGTVKSYLRGLVNRMRKQVVVDQEMDGLEEGEHRE